jgi:hypothetical protein
MASLGVARAQENIVRVVFKEDPSRTSVIGAFERNGTVYGSLSDIASLFSLSLKKAEDAQKAEVSGKPYRVRFTGANPFVTFLDATNRQTIYQLPHDVQYAAGTFFIPMAGFSPLFASMLGSQTRFDVESRTLTVIGPVPAGYDIPAVELDQKSNGMLVRIRSTKRFTDYVVETGRVALCYHLRGTRRYGLHQCDPIPGARSPDRRHPVTHLRTTHVQAHRDDRGNRADPGSKFQ